MINHKNIKYIIFLSCFLLLSIKASAQFYYDDDCTGIDRKFTPAGQGIVNGLPFSAYYTRDKFPADEGWLRLTVPVGALAGWVLADGTFPSNEGGVTVEFDFKAWIDKPKVEGLIADGFSVFLFDGSISNTDFSIGRLGGCMGYVPLLADLNGQKTGMKGGYMAVALDEVGNYWVHSQGQLFDPNYLNYRNTIHITGPAGADRLSGYKHIARTAFGTVPISYDPITPTRPADNVYYRRVKIDVTPAIGGGMDVKVYIRKDINVKDYVLLLSGKIPENAPEKLRIGFTGVTGGSDGYHEVKNVVIRTPGQTKAYRNYQSDCFSTIDNEFTVTSTFWNMTYTNLPSQAVKDILPPYFTPTSVTISGGTGTQSITPTSTQANGQKVFDYNIAMGQNSIVTVTWKGKFSRLPTNNKVSSTVALTAPLWDEDLTDNTSELEYIINRLKPITPTVNGAVFMDYNEAIIYVNKGEAKMLKVSTAPAMSSYQWQKAKAGTDAGWTNISGAIGTDYTAPVFTQSGQIEYYRCVANLGQACEHSVKFKVIVLPEVLSWLPMEMNWKPIIKANSEI